MAQEDTYENCLHYGIQLLKNQNLKQIQNSNNQKLIEKIDIKNYQDIFNEYKKITREDLKNYANKIFNFNSTDFLITTLSPVKIKDTIYANIYAF